MFHILIRSFFFSLFFINFTFPQFGVQKDLIKIQSYKSLDKISPGGEFKLAAKINIKDSWHINSNKPHEDFLIPTEFTIETNPNFILKSIVYPAPEDVKLAFSEKPLSVWQNEIIIAALIQTSDKIKEGEYPLVIRLNYQACNDHVCLPPSSAKDTIMIRAAGKEDVVNEINQDVFNKLDLSYSAVDLSKSIEKENPISSALEKNGLLLGIILVFLGGLALNLTPCVYPLIPITIGYFGGQAEGNTKKLFILGALYIVGMSLTYSVIGVATALSGAIFGSLLQNTFVIIFIALIFVALSLSMFGLYEFNLPNTLVAKAGGAKGGYYGAFFMGLTMGIVAAPCIGPFVLGLVTYVAAKADPYFGFLMFFVLSLGLGLPYMILAVFSGKIKKLPKSGEWMNAVKHVFGFILLGMAVYFILPLLPDSISGYVLPVYLFIAGFYLLFFDKSSNTVKGFRIFKILFSVVIIAAAVYAVVPSNKNTINWTPVPENPAVNNASPKKGIIIDFYADWCIPCKELDANTFSNPQVIEIAKDFYTYKADMTKSLSPEVEKLKDKYKIVGVPTILVTDFKGKEYKRITGFVNAQEFLEILNGIN
ncbi:MAG TPA: cytochrome c biogenesis protein CcdA [Ignavibacteriaceae bacterium]|nr:cytochrome c biogenesis protein CcdA [Ignavibacteriaceae bacterium]